LGFTLVETAIVVALLAIMAAVALPVYELYVRRSKTTEAAVNLRRIFDASVAYYQRDHSVREGDTLPRQFPATVSLTPGGAFCGPRAEGGRWLPRGEIWEQPTWQALSFALTQHHFYAYEFISAGLDGEARFTTRAIGDLDCDGVFSTFERVGRSDSDRNVVGASMLHTERELE